MKVTTKKTTKEKFIIAINTATAVIKSLHPRTKLAHYCEEFLELNEKTNKTIAKEQKKLTEPVYRELRKVRIDNAVEKDGVLDLDSEKNYRFNKAGEIAVLLKSDETQEKIEELLEPFIKEEVVIKCITTPLTLPEGIASDVEKALNGFVFQNKNEFEEEIEEVKE